MLDKVLCKFDGEHDPINRCFVFLLVMLESDWFQLGMRNDVEEFPSEILIKNEVEDDARKEKQEEGRKKYSPSIQASLKCEKWKYTKMNFAWVHTSFLSLSLLRYQNFASALFFTNDPVFTDESAVETKACLPIIIIIITLLCSSLSVWFSWNVSVDAFR